MGGGGRMVAIEMGGNSSKCDDNLASQGLYTSARFYDEMGGGGGVEVEQ